MPRSGSRALADQMRTFDENAFFEFANNHPIVTASVLKVWDTVLGEIKDDQDAELTEDDHVYFAQWASKLLEAARSSFHDQFANLHEGGIRKTLAYEALESPLFEDSDPFYANLVSLLFLPDFIELLEQKETVNSVITQRLKHFVAISGNSIEELSNCLAAYFSLQNSFETIVEVFEALHQRESISDPDAQKLKEKVFSLICNSERRRNYEPVFPMGSSDRFEADLRALEMLAKDYPYKVIELLMLKFQTPEEHMSPGGSGISQKPKGMSFLERSETCEFARAIHKAAEAELIARLENSTDPDETHKLIELCFRHAIFSDVFIRDIVTNNRKCS
ncbi:MAG TPA: hypothetical protein VJ044_13040, partial [Candidatus Hodarchaeales archaeon]|nr:hypothetical protein [Candidatus Hodarchaeales archaeon]